jgi:hypothetical protein
MCAFPLRRQRPAFAFPANGLNQSVEGFIEIDLAGFDQGVSSGRAREKDEPRIHCVVAAHGSPPK